MPGTMVAGMLILPGAWFLLKNRTDKTDRTNHGTYRTNRTYQ